MSLFDTYIDITVTLKLGESMKGPMLVDFIFVTLFSPTNPGLGLLENTLVPCATTLTFLVSVEQLLNDFFKLEPAL